MPGSFLLTISPRLGGALLLRSVEVKVEVRGSFGSDRRSIIRGKFSKGEVLRISDADSEGAHLYLASDDE